MPDWQRSWQHGGAMLMQHTTVMTVCNTRCSPLFMTSHPHNKHDYRVNAAAVAPANSLHDSSMLWWYI